MPRAKKLAKSEFGAKAVEFLNIAYKDYLAARVLLNAGLLPQGAVLASTAIEKYFKAVLAFRGNESKGHLSSKHINSAMNYDARLAAVLSEPFLLLLQKAYEIRYTDNLQVGFSIVIAYREFLAELDKTALTIQQSFRLQLNGSDAILSFDLDRDQRCHHLLENNHLLLGIDKQAFISSDRQAVYELRYCAHRGLLETTYLSLARPSDGAFLREGFLPVDTCGVQYQLSLAPIATT